jgi:hypothetical protein
VANGTLRRRSRDLDPRPKVVQFSLTQEEFDTTSQTAAGTNLNQAVARLNATGEPSGDLIPAAQF